MSERRKNEPKKRVQKRPAVSDYWFGYGYDHLAGCSAVPRCICGYIETMRSFFDARMVPDE